MRERKEKMEIQETISKELLTLLIELCTHQEIDIELYKNLTDKEKEIFDILNEETMGGFVGNLSKVDILVNVVLFLRTGEYMNVKLGDFIEQGGVRYNITWLIDPKNSCARKFIVVLLPDTIHDWGWENRLFNITKDYFIPFGDVWLFKQALKKHDDHVLRCVSEKMYKRLGEKYENFLEDIKQAAEQEILIEEWE